jgi:hypothetical protein
MDSLELFTGFLSGVGWLLSLFSFVYTLKKYKAARTWFTFFTFRSAFAVTIAQTFNFFGLALGFFPWQAEASFYYLGTIGLWAYMQISIYRFQILAVLQPKWMQKIFKIKKIGPVTFVILCTLCWPVWVVYGSPQNSRFSPWLENYAMNGTLSFVFFISFSDFILQCLSLFYTMKLKKELTRATTSNPSKLLTKDQQKSFLICISAVVLSMVLLSHVYLHAIAFFSEQVLPAGQRLCLLYASGCLHMCINYFYMFEIAKLLRNAETPKEKDKCKTGGSNKGSADIHSRDPQSNTEVTTAKAQVTQVHVQPEVVTSV